MLCLPGGVLRRRNAVWRKMHLLRYFKRSSSGYLALLMTRTSSPNYPFVADSLRGPRSMFIPYNVCRGWRFAAQHPPLWRFIGLTTSVLVGRLCCETSSVTSPVVLSMMFRTFTYLYIHHPMQMTTTHSYPYYNHFFYAVLSSTLRASTSFGPLVLKYPICVRSDPGVDSIS